MLTLLFFWVGVVHCAPSIVALRGCISEIGAVTTFNCPTDAYDRGLLLTVVGKQLCSNGFCARLFVGGEECVGSVSVTPNATLVNELLLSDAISSSLGIVALTCQLNNGVGRDLNVYAVDQTGGEMLQGLLSYAYPTIDDVNASSPCVKGPQGVTQCPRGGNVTLTIRGRNLGSGLTINIGSSLCSSVSWLAVHSLVQCVLPAGSSLNQQVSVSQTNGLSTGSSFTVSYRQCSPGSRSSGTSCVLCSPGTYSPTTESAICQPCAPGQYSESGAAVCIKCQPGRASPLAGAKNCTDCPGGTVSPSWAAYTCDSCLPGRFSTSPGRSSCDRCPVSQFTPVLPPVACVECPSNARPAGNLTYCECDSGFYESLDGKCVACPEGALCTRAGMTFVGLQAAANFRPTTDGDKTRFVSCINDACPLGDCAPGYQGALCTECADGYGVMFRNSCAACWARGAGEVVALVIGVLLLVLVAMLVWRVQVAAEAEEYDRAVVLAKVLVTTLQMNAMVAELLPASHSSVLASLLIVQESFITVPLNVLSNDCFYAGNAVHAFYSDSVIIGMMPVFAVLGVLLLCFFLAVCTKLCSVGERRSLCSECVALLSPTSLVVVFCLYYVINTQTLRMFKCVTLSDVPSRSFLVGDTTEECWAPNHVTWVVTVAVPCLIVYSFGLPLLTLALLCKNRGLKKLPGLFFLEGGFHKRFFWWESLTFFRTWLCAAISVYWVNDRQSGVASALFVIVLFGVLHCLAYPHRSDGVNVLEGISLFATFLALVSCQLEWFGGDTLLTRVFSALTIITFALFFLGMCLMALTQGGCFWPCALGLYRYCCGHRHLTSGSMSAKLNDLFNRGSVSDLVYHNDHHRVQETEMNHLRPVSQSNSKEEQEREAEYLRNEEKHERKLKQWQDLAKKQTGELQATNEELIRLRKQLIEFVEWEEEMSRLLKFYEARGGPAKSPLQPAPQQVPKHAPQAPYQPPQQPPYQAPYQPPQQPSYQPPYQPPQQHQTLHQVPQPLSVLHQPLPQPSQHQPSQPLHQPPEQPLPRHSPRQHSPPPHQPPALPVQAVEREEPFPPPSHTFDEDNVVRSFGGKRRVRAVPLLTQRGGPSTASALAASLRSLPFDSESDITPSTDTSSNNSSTFGVSPSPMTTLSSAPTTPVVSSHNPFRNVSTPPTLLTTRPSRAPSNAPPPRPLLQSPSFSSTSTTTQTTPSRPYATTSDILPSEGSPPPPPPESDYPTSSLPIFPTSSYMQTSLATAIPTLRKSPPSKVAPSVSPKLRPPVLAQPSTTESDPLPAAPKSPWSSYTSSPFTSSVPSSSCSPKSSSSSLAQPPASLPPPVTLPLVDDSDEEAEKHDHVPPALEVAAHRRQMSSAGSLDLLFDQSGYLHSRNESLGLDNSELVTDFLASRPLPTLNRLESPTKSPPRKILPPLVTEFPALNSPPRSPMRSPSRHLISLPPLKLSDQSSTISAPRPQPAPSRPPPSSPEGRSGRQVSLDSVHRPALKLEPQEDIPTPPRLSPSTTPTATTPTKDVINASSSIAQTWRAQQLQKLKNTSPTTATSSSFSFPRTSPSSSQFSNPSSDISIPSSSISSDFASSTPSFPPGSEAVPGDNRVADAPSRAAPRAHARSKTPVLARPGAPERDSFFVMPESDSE